MPLFQVSETELRFTKGTGAAGSVRPVIRSVSNSDAIFKVKTTSPERYSVKPRSGVLRSADSVRIDITFRPTEAPEVARDKFQIEIRPLTETEARAIALERTDKAAAQSLLDAGRATDLVSWLWKQSGGAPPEKYVLSCVFDEEGAGRRASPAPQAASEENTREARATYMKEIEDARAEILVRQNGQERELTQISKLERKLSSPMSSAVLLPPGLAFFLLLVGVALGYCLRSSATEVAVYLKMLQDAVETSGLYGSGV